MIIAYVRVAPAVVVSGGPATPHDFASRAPQRHVVRSAVGILFKCLAKEAEEEGLLRLDSSGKKLSAEEMEQDGARGIQKQHLGSHRPDPPAEVPRVPAEAVEAGGDQHVPLPAGVLNCVCEVTPRREERTLPQELAHHDHTKSHGGNSVGYGPGCLQTRRGPAWPSPSLIDEYRWNSCEILWNL